MKIIKLVPIMLLALLFIFEFGCGPKPIQKESVLDTPQTHYNQGMREVERGDLDAAVLEFERAIALDPDFGDGFSGLALVAATRENFKEAYDLADKGIDKNKKSVDARIIKGRIHAMEHKGDDWIKKAVKEYDDALKINPNSDKAMYYKGEAYKNAYMFSEAAGEFRKVIAAKGDFAEKANSEWEIVQKIQRAAPGTKVGAKIALIEEIDRADLSVLLIEELKLLTVLDKKQPKTYDTGFTAPEDPTQMQTEKTEKMAAMTDIESHWAKNWIEDIVKSRVIDVFPDHTFRPDEKITRANYALVMQNILLLVTGDESLATNILVLIQSFRMSTRLILLIMLFP